LAAGFQNEISVRGPRKDPTGSRYLDVAQQFGWCKRCGREDSHGAYLGDAEKGGHEESAVRQEKTHRRIPCNVMLGEEIGAGANILP